MSSQRKASLSSRNGTPPSTKKVITTTVHSTTSIPSNETAFTNETNLSTTTTNSTTQSETITFPVTIVATEKGVNTTSTFVTKDIVTSITTVTSLQPNESAPSLPSRENTTPSLLHENDSSRSTSSSLRGAFKQTLTTNPIPTAPSRPTVLKSSLNRTQQNTTTSSSSVPSSPQALTQWFLNNFRENETQLYVASRQSTNDTSRLVCNGLPALLTRSSTMPSNRGCLDELTALNTSCTCLTGLRPSATSWTFTVTSKSQTTTPNNKTPPSKAQSSSTALKINTIRPIWIPSSLKTLVITSPDALPANIAFITGNRDVVTRSLPLVWSVNRSSIHLSTLKISNLNLNAIAATKSNFVPDTVTHLTLRQCNISTLSHAFTRSWRRLEVLDMSLNHLQTDVILAAEPALKALNLSHNALTRFPTRSLNGKGLEALYLQGNDITDWNVSQDAFRQIQELQSFQFDPPRSSSLTCQNGVWKVAHGVAFCVLKASTSASQPPLPDSSSIFTRSNDNEGLAFMTYWLIAGTIIVLALLLLVIWKRQRSSHDSEDPGLGSPAFVESTTPLYYAKSTSGYELHCDTIRAASPALAPDTSFYDEYDDKRDQWGSSLARNSVLRACRVDYNEVKVGRCISRGGFGLVFVGSYRGRPVAVKKIRNERDVRQEQVDQFVREIELMAGLKHPRIVEFLGACWTVPTELSCVTELMERGDLREVTQRFKRRGDGLTWETHKATIALHIAEALTYLHGLKPTLIHRDLKAKNVMLNTNMEAKLSDFGIARKRSGGSEDRSEHMTVGIGTSFWIAPEVLLGHAYDERADIYSFGVVLSELDTDDYPYWNSEHPPQGRTQENEILRLVAGGTKRPTFSASCPSVIYELAAQCLRADPEERPSAVEIVHYLQRLVSEQVMTGHFGLVPSTASIKKLRCSSQTIHEIASSSASIFDASEFRATMLKDEEIIVTPSPHLTQQGLRIHGSVKM